jgi:electron transfer flavoprotein alpha subunit
VRELAVTRRRTVLGGPLPEQVAQALALLRDTGALPVGDPPRNDEAPVPDDWKRGEKGVVVLLPPDRPLDARQLLGSAARLAQVVNGHVSAVAVTGTVDPALVGSWGADELMVIQGSAVEEDLAPALARWVDEQATWAVLAPGTLFGREVASRLAARLGAGLTGDAIDLAVDRGRLVGWKPAFGGRLVASITSTSAVQLVTVRPGMLATPAPRSARAVPVRTVVVRPLGRVRVLASGRDDDLDELATAEVIVGVGAGVDPTDYGRLTPLLDALGAQLAATRKATDQGWQPRSRQIGLTGRSLAPRLYVAIGLSGKFNHLVGVRGAGMILAINDDPGARVFAGADVGIVGDWRKVVPLLVAQLAHEGWVDAKR